MLCNHCGWEPGTNPGCMFCKMHPRPARRTNSLAELREMAASVVQVLDAVAASREIVEEKQEGKKGD
jgi:hypothetical protein